MAISDADRLLAKGALVQIGDQSVRVRFDFESLLFLEKEYGGLDVFYAKLMERGFGATRVDTIFKGMVAGLLATRSEDQEVEDFQRELMKTLEPSDSLRYLEAVVQAFAESIPGLEIGAAPKARGRRSHSPGNGSTGLPLSTVVAPTGSSGA